jgi:general secretion pathway protein G
MNRRSRRRRRGFTLMEILLVLAILVVLGSMVTVGYVQIQKDANIKAARSQISLLEDAVNLYQLNVGTCPSTQQGLEALLAMPPDLPVPQKWTGPYLNKRELPFDPWNQPYNYEQLDASQFRIWSNGPNSVPGDEDDISTTL